MEEILVINVPLSIGRKAQLLRIAQGFTQDDLALLVGVKQQEVSALERCCPVRPESAQRILAFLGLDKGKRNG